MRILFFVLTFILVVGAITSAKGADTNTVSSTVVTNNTPSPANAIAAFNQAQPMSTQQLSFAPQQPLSQAPGGLAQFSSMLNRFN